MVEADSLQNLHAVALSFSEMLMSQLPQTLEIMKYEVGYSVNK